MKKYQLWLQRKSYSQHLFNLMRIRCAQQSPDRLNKTTYKNTGKENSFLPKYKQMEEYQEEATKLGDLSYAITFKELKNRKLRLMKSFEILNQNMSMARRIKEVKSVFSGKDKNVQGELNKRKAFEKKCQISNQQLRKQIFKKYKKIQNNCSKSITKYRLTLTFVSAPRIFHAHSQFVAFWSELHTQKGVIRSDFLKTEQLQGQTVSFPLEDPLEKQPVLRIFFSKGLSSEQVGNFVLVRPELGWVPKTVEVNSEDNRIKLHIRISYNYTRRQKHSFTFK